MSGRAQYQTKHRDELLAYLESTAGEHITVSGLCDHFKSVGRPIGTTTVYRHLERLVDQGLVAKYVIDQSSPACFEYVGEASRGDGACCHCKCEICGKVEHMHCDEIPNMQRHVREHHGFTIDTARTVFYGVCGECASKR